MKFLMVVILLSAFNLQAQECDGEVVVPSLTCLNPMGGADVRLYIMEFQTCQNGKIIELDRNIIGMNDGNAVYGSDIQITYSESRQKIDAANRVDHLSFLMPKEVKMIDGNQSIEMMISTKTAVDGSGSLHYLGSFKTFKTDGTLDKKGKLICSVDR